jgi:hypothetical protein
MALFERPLTYLISLVPASVWDGVISVLEWMVLVLVVSLIAQVISYSRGGKVK